MATINKRVYTPQAMTINGVAVGGILTVAIQEGYENVLRSPPDGIGGPAIIDKNCQFCRGTIMIQDWPDAISLLTGTVGTCVFYERKSGAAAATGYTKHTLTAPVIHTIALTFTKGGYATVAASFECKAADETKTIADMHAMTDSQNAPTYVPAARGGYRIESIALGELDIYHLTGLTFSIIIPLARDCNDADVAYTCVDAKLDGMTCNGSLSFQDSEITSAKLKCQQLLLAAVADLVIVVTQSQGAADKTITIANVSFVNAGENPDVNADFTGFTAAFEVANDPDTPLTLDGVNKIITITAEARAAKAKK